MRYEVFTLGKHYLHVHTSKGFTLFANAKIVNGQLSSYTDKMTRRGGSWVIDVWRFLSREHFPVNPIYTAVFGFDDDDTEVSVNSTDIDVESISGVNGQLVDVGNISVAQGQSLPVNADYIGKDINSYTLEYNEYGYPIFPHDSTNYKILGITGGIFNKMRYVGSDYTHWVKWSVDTTKNKLFKVEYQNGQYTCKIAEICEIGEGDGCIDFTGVTPSGEYITSESFYYYSDEEISNDCKGMGIVYYDTESRNVVIWYY